MTRLEVDYLVVGSGAVGMAFADVLLQESNCSIVMIDRHHNPGGHWNDAYSFVRLHQPSEFYGVNSATLGRAGRETTGLNIGDLERASGSEILAYYEHVMQSFLETGRLRYFPMCDYVGDFENVHVFRSMTSGFEHSISVRNKIIDTTYLNTAVPSTHPPRYEIAAGVRCVSVNELPKIKNPPTGYCVVGAGKTGVDACLWLLENGVNPDSICWIMPRDAWYQNRANVQPGYESFLRSFGAIVNQLEAVGQSTSGRELLDRLNADEVLLRLDDSVEPEMYHGATISHSELATLRQIGHVVRMGRVQKIETHQIELDKGTVASDPGWLYVDCSASAVERRPSIPIFSGRKITPQFVRSVQPVFSAAFIAHIELTLDHEDEKNGVCTVVPVPDRPADWLVTFAVNMLNRHRWKDVAGLAQWIADSRLDGFSNLPQQVEPGHLENAELLKKFAAAIGPATQNITRLFDPVAVGD
jgi:NAD(P)-binding Rossmann-like domain